MSVAARRGGQFVRRLAHRLHGAQAETGSAIWETIQLARHQDRPYPLDYISRLFPDFEELHGDRLYGDDPAIVAGIGRGEDGPVVVIGHQKGRDTAERTYRNFGMPGPEGYRKAMRVMALADKMNLPVITLIDTPGAFPGAGAEERGQGGAIARSMQTMLRLRTPSVAVVIGEGSSGGALALGVTDRVMMLENATYSVISPEGGAAILWRDAAKARDAATAFQPTAANCYRWGIADVVVPEPSGGAHRDHDEAARLLGRYLSRALRDLQALSPAERKRLRRDRYRRIGAYREVASGDPTAMAAGRAEARGPGGNGAAPA
ncbi:acetyl-CoA carboxylase carboxyltransferase subunit alpha [Miltoncostaea oceani]|uniref:acetyl-CoA carboxylase carboxyltransferase subunit alpha n=1 Tax=Miltoncostaea oceani TaxID=2843216 RepID=UPI001C3E7087|nr:acetyl-CoA carboxylase carboxyltransferase subunit alpha [Miltoncostaea oceani]